jgi:hypothetical protein
MPEGTIWLKKVGDFLVPTDDDSRKLLGSIPENVMVLTNVRTPRNPNQLRLIWHLARLVFDNTEQFESAEHVMEQIKIGTGYSVRTLLVIPGVGEVWQVRGKSIAYESMPQSEFAQWLETALDYVAADLLPGVDRDEIVKHIEELMAPAPQRRGHKKA